MLGLRTVGGCLLTALLVLNCGGRSTLATNSDASVGGAGSDANECSGGAPDGGCNGAGERALEPYARLRTACSLNVKVNRRGAAVCIDYHLK